MKSVCVLILRIKCAHDQPWECFHSFYNKTLGGKDMCLVIYWDFGSYFPELSSLCIVALSSTLGLHSMIFPFTFISGASHHFNCQYYLVS